jgi:hypothetical protein
MEVVVVQYKKQPRSRNYAFGQLYSCGVRGHPSISEEALGRHARAAHRTPLYVIIPLDEVIETEKLPFLIRTRDAEEVSWATGLSVYHNVEDWPATAHEVATPKICPHHGELISTIKLRRIGWIDQRGNVWTDEKAWRKAGGPNGSLTPLLINPGCD